MSYIQEAAVDTYCKSSRETMTWQGDNKYGNHSRRKLISKAKISVTPIKQNKGARLTEVSEAFASKVEPE